MSELGLYQVLSSVRGLMPEVQLEPDLSLRMIQLKLAKVTGHIAFQKRQEVGSEWKQKIAYRAHVFSEWATRYFTYLGYQREDMLPTNLQLLLEWRMHSELSQYNAQADEEDGDHSPPNQIVIFYISLVYSYLCSYIFFFYLYIVFYLCECGTIFMVNILLVVSKFFYLKGFFYFS